MVVVSMNSRFHCTVENKALKEALRTGGENFRTEQVGAIEKFRVGQGGVFCPATFMHAAKKRVASESPCR